MKTHVYNDKLYIEAPYLLRNKLKDAGFVWDPMRKMWWTQQQQHMESMPSMTGEQAAQYLSQLRDEKLKRIQESRAQDADIEIPAPKGLSYLPYQKAGIQYITSRKGTLLGDSMGLGKTVQAIGACNYLKAKSVLVICPSSLKPNWKKEMTKWMVDTSITIDYASSKYFPQTDVVIINYEILKRYRSLLRQREWEVLIVDECHYIKNDKSQRTREVVGGKIGREKIPALEAKRKLFLTGTPILNKPIEIWTAIHYLDPESWNNKWAFMNRYCGAHRDKFGLKNDGATNLEELQEKLRSTVMIRRMTEDVLPDLPKKTRQVVEIPAETKKIKEQIKEEQRVMQEHSASLDGLRQALARAEETGDMEGYKRSVEQLREGVKAGLQLIAKMRYETAMVKVPLMVSYVKEVLETQDKVIIFAHHNDVVDELMKSFKGLAVRVTGKDKVEDRQKSVERFQSDPDCRLFIGSIKAAGVGLTLTAANMVVFAELDWVPANLLQAEDRARRIGQQRNVLIQHFVLERSIDANMANKIVAKQNIADAALDNKLSIEMELPVLPF